MSDNGPKWGTLEWNRLHPIYLSVEEMKQPPEVLLKGIRSQLSELRGQLGDVRSGYGWSDRIETPEHGLTLIISYLYGVMEEIEKCRKLDQEEK